jgi:hypothetical protein
MDALDLTNKKKRAEAQQGCAEKISSEIVPCLFHDSEKKAWAFIPVDGHYETWEVKGEKMSLYIQGQFWEEWKRCFGQGTPIPAGMLKERVALLEAMARFDGAEKSVALRVGASNPRVLYIDLCDDRRRVVRIDPVGWEVEDASEVFFRRTDEMLALPIPERGGSVEELQPFLNIGDDQFTLAIGWLLAALRSWGPYPLAVLIGPAGSAKSSFAKILRDLTDPDRIPLSGPPREVRDLTVVSQHSHVLAFDNLSSLGPQLSNALCRLATGGGNRERRFYTNREQARFPFVARPIILNGIRLFVVAPDLLDRSIVLHLQHVDHKRTEAALRRDFNNKKGRIFGGLLDLMVEGVRNLPSAPAESSSRMVEAITWCTACGLADFEHCYQQNLADNNRAIIEHDALAVGIRALMRNRERWTGTMTELKAILEATGHQIWDHLQTLSEHLREIAPALRSGFGIAVKFVRTKKERLIEISSSPSSSSSSPDEDR